VSKERARRRAVREQQAAQRLAQREADRLKAAGRARRRARLRRLLGLRRSSPDLSRSTALRRERRAAAGALVLVAAMAGYLLSHSWTVVIGVLLVSLLCLPVLLTSVFNRHPK